MAIDLCRRKARFWFGAAALAASGLLYAEGVMKSGWFEAGFLVIVAYFFLSPAAPASVVSGLMIVTAISLTLVVGDIALRPFLEERLNYTPLNVYSHSHPPLPIVARWDPNLHLVDQLYGDLAAMHGDPSLREMRRILFETDEAGFRNTSMPEQIDLLILGDSFSAGWETSQEHLFARLLERYGLRTYNLAYPGGPYDQYINFAIEWPRLRMASPARLVWTIYVGNDLDDEGGSVWDIDSLPWRSSIGQWLVRYRTYRNRSPLNRLSNNLLARWRNRQSSGSGITIKRMPDGTAILFLDSHDAWSRRSKADIEAHPNYTKLHRTFAVMKNLAADRKIDVTVLILPTKGDVYRWIVEQRLPTPEDRVPSAIGQAIRQACEQAGLRCIDMKPYLFDQAVRLYESSGELLWWRDDTHLGDRGHEAVANFIAHEVLPANLRATQ